MPRNNKKPEEEEKGEEGACPGASPPAGWGWRFAGPGVRC